MQKFLLTLDEKFDKSSPKSSKNQSESWEAQGALLHSLLAVHFADLSS
jgi:hypothetical protein